MPEHYEMFCDMSYYDMWCVRLIGSHKFGEGLHFMRKEEAKRAKDLLEERWGTELQGQVDVIIDQ